MPKHPIQPLQLENETLRFKSNAIVLFLLDNGPFDLNHLGRQRFSQEDHEQFAQLIGYSLAGASELHYVRSDVLDVAEMMFKEGCTEKDARIECLESQVETVKNSLREAVAALFNIHPGDLK